MNIKTQQHIKDNSEWIADCGCWIWAGTAWRMRGKGERYGRIGKSDWAHRVSHEVFKGEISKGMLVHHRCETPLCVNPSHLELVSQSGHNKFHHSGENNCWAKLTEAQVREIWRLRKEGLSGYKIADMTGMSKQAIWHILRGHNWRHIYAEQTQ